MALSSTTLYSGAWVSKESQMLRVQHEVESRSFAALRFCGFHTYTKGDGIEETRLNLQDKSRVRRDEAREAANQ